MDDYTNDISSTASITKALLNAYASWEDVPGATNLTFEFKNGEADGNYDVFEGFDGSSATLDQDAEWRFANIVMGGWLDASYFSKSFGSPNILAVTWTGRLTGDGSRKPAWHSEIFFNDGFAWGADGNCEIDNTQCFDIEIVFRHELGHAIGFDHELSEPDSVMAPIYDSEIMFFSESDMEGAVALYGGGGGGGNKGGGGGNKGKNNRGINALSADFHVIRVPEPSTLAIFGLGLVGLGFTRRKRTR